MAQKGNEKGPELTTRNGLGLDSVAWTKTPTNNNVGEGERKQGFKEYLQFPDSSRSCGLSCTS